MCDKNFNLTSWPMRISKLSQVPIGHVLNGLVHKTYVKRPLKNRHKKFLMANGSLMEVKSIAECSPWIAQNVFS